MPSMFRENYQQMYECGSGAMSRGQFHISRCQFEGNVPAQKMIELRTFRNCDRNRDARHFKKQELENRKNHPLETQDLGI